MDRRKGSATPLHYTLRVESLCGLPLICDGICSGNRRFSLAWVERVLRSSGMELRYNRNSQHIIGQPYQVTIFQNQLRVMNRIIVAHDPNPRLVFRYVGHPTHKAISCLIGKMCRRTWKEQSKHPPCRNDHGLIYKDAYAPTFFLPQRVAASSLLIHRYWKSSKRKLPILIDLIIH